MKDISLMPIRNASSSPFALSPKIIGSWLCMVFLAGLYLRIQGPYYDYSYSNDEAMNLGVTSGSSLADVLRYSLYESHPPLFYILLHYWMSVSTDSTFVRSFQLILGLSLIPLYYFIGKRIDGELCGLCCATLIAFSYGCTIQSAVMRHYNVMLVILSLNFYRYIVWRGNRTLKLLGYYVLSGCLAVFSNFFSVIYFFCVGIFELATLYARSAKRSVINQWIVANGVIGLAAGTYYYIWHSTLLHYHHVLYGNYAPDLLEKILYAIYSPVAAANYISVALPIIIVLGCALSFKGSFLSDKNSSRSFFWLGCVAWVTCGVITFTGIYPTVGTRHSLWIVPLLLPAIALLLIDILKKIDGSWNRIRVRVILMLLLVLALHDMARRPFDEEYSSWQKGQWKAVTEMLKSFGPHDVIVTDKDGLNLLANMYPFRADAVFMNETEPRLTPYYQTHILVNSDYFGIYSHQAVRSMLNAAEANHLLDNIGNIIFVKLWAKWPFYELLTCDKLSRKIFIPFTPKESEQPGHSIHSWSFAVIEVSKATFFKEVMDPNGDSVKCLPAGQDTQEKGYYIPMTAKRPAL